MGPHDEPITRVLGAGKRAVGRVTFVDCGHSGEFTAPWPEIGQTVYCRRCNNYQVVGGLLHDYRAYCHEGARCLKRSSYGADRVRALQAASEHVLTHPSHQVELLDNWQPDRWVRYGHEQQELPFQHLTDVRTDAGKVAQKSLTETLDKAYTEAQARRVPPHGGTDGHQEGPEQ